MQHRPDAARVPAVGRARSRTPAREASCRSRRSGNSDADLAHPAAENDCKVVPAETAGVIGVSALGPSKEKASYSNWGQVDVAAPGGTGTGDCSTGVLSTLPAAPTAASPAPPWPPPTRQALRR